MKATLTIDDDLFEIYKTEAGQRGVPVGQVISERLARAVALDPRTRAMVLDGGMVMQKIEEKLGGGQVKGAEDLLKKVTNLASIRFGSHEFQITPGQYRELAFRATKMGSGKTPEDLIAEIYRRMQATFFEYVP